MLIPLIAFIAGTAVTIFFGWVFGSGNIRLLYGFFPGLIAMIAVFFLGMRRLQKELMAVGHRVQEILTQMSATPGKQPNEALVRRQMDEAIAVLQGAMKFRLWAPFVGGQLSAQIGQLYYMSKRFDEAMPWLEKASAREWMAQAMRGAHLCRTKRYGDMKTVFEKAVGRHKKESLLWNLYAWCLEKSGDRDAALEVLGRAKKAVPTDERTQKNHEALQRGKAMKMQGWQMLWYQFQLEKPPAQPVMKQRVDRRALYRGR